MASRRLQGASFTSAVARSPSPRGQCVRRVLHLMHGRSRSENRFANLAVWLNSNNNRAITRKQDREVKQAVMKILLLNMEKAFMYVSPIECTIFYISKHVNTLPKSVFNKIYPITKNSGAK